MNIKEVIQNNNAHGRILPVGVDQLSCFHKGIEKLTIQCLGFSVQMLRELVIGIHKQLSFQGQAASAAAGTTPVAGDQGESQFIFHPVEHIPGSGVGDLHQTAGIPDGMGILHQMQQHGQPGVIQWPAVIQSYFRNGTGQLPVMILDQQLPMTHVRVPKKNSGVFHTAGF